MSFRSGLNRICPPWLQRHVGSRFMYSMGVVIDAVAESLYQGILARFPGMVPGALGRIGRDRRIVRGFEETDESYAERQLRWLDDWAIAGSPPAVLAQTAGYLTPRTVQLRTVDRRGNWYTKPADGGPVVWTQLDNWNWDAQPVTEWARLWLILYGPWDDDGTWDDDGVWDDGGTWDSTATPEEVATVRAIILEWKGTHAKLENIIIAFDPSLFNPASPEPDGLWGSWSKEVAGVRVSARDVWASFWDGET